MLIKSITMRPGAHFHARPAADLAVLARQFESVLLISVGEELADAKNALALMRLPKPKDGNIELTASGPDEEEVMRPQQNTGNAAERVRTRPAAFLFLISEKSVNIGNQTDAGGG